MKTLKQHFIIGFNEGWSTFWVPFTGLFTALMATWKKHVGAQESKSKHKHA